MKKKRLFKTSLKIEPDNIQPRTSFLDIDNHFSTTDERNKVLTLIERYKREAMVDDETGSVSLYFLQTSEMAKATLQLLDKIHELETEEGKIKTTIHDIKRTEMDRVFKEFLTNDYERRFKVTKNIVISALIGEENVTDELTRQAREQKVFHEKLKRIRTYNLNEESNIIKFK
jgi:hypothetical protein